MVYGFSGADGGDSKGVLVEPAAGAIFGATQYGGATNYGTVFKLVSSGVAWIESVLYSFGAKAGGGRYPASWPVEDLVTGVLYGATSEGGNRNDGGTLYQLTQQELHETRLRARHGRQIHVMVVLQSALGSIHA